MPRHYTCFRTSSKINVDGRLDDAAWAAAAWSEPFDDITGDPSLVPPLRTRVKMLWDDVSLYVGADLEDKHVWATLKKRDSVIFHDNDFEVFIDPDGDNHQYYEIEINALNTVWDLLLIKPYRDGGPAVTGWDIAGLRTAVHVNGTLNDPSDEDGGWTVEMAFPWAALAECAHTASPPAEGDTWRINFSRVQWQTSVEAGKYVKTPGRREDNWVWSPQGVVDMHRPETWGYVSFINQVHSAGAVHRFTDPAEPVRDLLMRIYRAQRSYYGTHNRYADHTALLGIDASAIAGAADLKIEVMNGAFVAAAEVETNGKRVRWQVREDSRLWSTALSLDGSGPG